MLDAVIPNSIPITSNKLEVILSYDMGGTGGSAQMMAAYGRAVEGLQSKDFLVLTSRGVDLRVTACVSWSQRPLDLMLFLQCQHDLSC